MNEATMTDADMKQREKIVKSMKKNFKDFRNRYGADAKNVMYATATKMAMKEAVKDEADKGEYDYEGDMAKSSLRTIVRNAQMMHDMLDENTNLPEWVASKVTLAEDYIVAATQYMQSEMSEEVEIQELDTDTYRRAGNARIDQGNAATTQKDQDKKFAKGMRLHKFADKQEKRPGQSFFGKGGPSGNPIKKMKEEVELEEGSYDTRPGAASKSKRIQKKAASGWNKNWKQYVKNMKVPKSQRKSASIATGKTKKGQEDWAKHGNKNVKHSTGPYMGEEVEIEEGKWNYPADMTKTKTTSQTGSTNAADNRARRKAFRKKTKAAAHKKLMSGMKEAVAQMDEYNATPFRNTERGARGSKPAGQPRTSNSRQFFRPPEGFTKKGIEKGGGIKTMYHYKGKSNTPSGATMKMGGVTVPMGKTPTKRRVKEEIGLEENQYSLPAGSTMNPNKKYEKPKSPLEKRFGHLKPGQSASLKGDPKKVMNKTNEEQQVETPNGSNN